MDRKRFLAMFESFAKSAFRLQTRSFYAVDNEAGEYSAFIRGESFPDRQDDPWISEIRANIRAGKTMANVHVLSSPLTPYLRYGIDWCYTYRAAAGEDSRFILPEAAAPVADQMTMDFWLFDDAIVAIMEYDKDGRFIGPHIVEESHAVREYCTIRDEAMRRSIDLRALLAKRRHGELP